MKVRLASIRMRTTLHDQLRLLAANLSQQRETRITIRSIVEEGILGMLDLPPSALAQWATESLASISSTSQPSEPSISFRITADYVRRLGVFAAQITMQTKIPITKAQLVEEAGRRIISQIQAEQEELKALT